MKAKSSLLILPILCTASLIGCNSKVHFNKVSEILEGSRVFEVSYDKVNYEKGDKFWKDNNDNWSGGCSAVTKNINGHRIVGRNMDLNIADKAAYIIRTNASEGRYRTIGTSYTYRDYAPFYSEVKQKGITDEFKDILPFLCDDVMNDQGLHIEVNMRHSESDAQFNDLFALKETNPGKQRVHMFELPRYIAEHCKTVEEAKNYVNNELDIYSKNEYWNYCFVITDSNTDGSVQHAALLEFSQIGVIGETYNELTGTATWKAVNWLDEADISKVNWLTYGLGEEKTSYPMNAISQTNFFINEWAYYRQDVKSGEGRFITIQKLINSVNSKSEMYDLMRRISYSYFYNDYDVCDKYHFDPRSENLGEFQGCSYSFMYATEPAMKDIIKNLLNDYTNSIKNMSREERAIDGTIWESTFTEVVDVTERNFEIRFFEDESLRFKVSFDAEVEHLETLPTKSATDWSELPNF